MVQVVFVVLAVIAASIHLALSSSSRSTGAAIAGTFLLYLLFFMSAWRVAYRIRARVSTDSDIRLYRVVDESIRVRSWHGRSDRRCAWSLVPVTARQLLARDCDCQRCMVPGRCCGTSQGNSGPQ